MTARNWKTWVCGLALACSCSLGLAQGLEYEFREGDFESIYHGSSSSLVIWRWSGNRNVYVFDFPNLTVQGRTFNRVTQLTEQFAEPYKRVLTTPELEQYYFALRRTEANFAFGNDVLVSELVLFFNLARRDKVELYPEELGLRDFLVQQGMMREWRGFYQALTPDVVLLSIPQRQEAQPGEPPVSGWARQNILMHELAHAEYYTNVQYANYCRKFWYQTLNSEFQPCD